MNNIDVIMVYLCEYNACFYFFKHKLIIYNLLEKKKVKTKTKTFQTLSSQGFFSPITSDVN